MRKTQSFIYKHKQCKSIFAHARLTGVCSHACIQHKHLKPTPAYNPKKLIKVLYKLSQITLWLLSNQRECNPRLHQGCLNSTMGWLGGWLGVSVECHILSMDLACVRVDQTAADRQTHTVCPSDCLSCTATELYLMAPQALKVNAGLEECTEPGV